MVLRHCHISSSFIAAFSAFTYIFPDDTELDQSSPVIDNSPIFTTLQYLIFVIQVLYALGGVARNVAECMSKLGTKPYMISAVGLDMAGISPGWYSLLEFALPLFVIHLLSITVRIASMQFRA